jgi:hypothetical protein
VSSFRKPIKIRDVAPGAMDANGRWVEGAEVARTIRATVQPASGKDLLALEEGRRNRATYVLYTDSLLEIKDAKNPPRVTLFGDDFEAVHVEPWQNGVRPHFKGLFQKRQKVAEAVDA